MLWNKWRLVKGKELYDLRNRPGPEDRRRQPSIRTCSSEMRDHYEEWWAGVAPTARRLQSRSVLGSERENPVTLSAADWANVYCDNMNDLRNGKHRNGPWHVLVDRTGTYEIALRRWPKEADAAIAGGVPAFKAVDGGLPAGKALPIASARLKVGGVDETKPVGPADKAITFKVQLKAGTKMPMQTWFSDKDGHELCGAYFTDVRWIKGP